MNKLVLGAAVLSLASPLALAADYAVDTDGAHASVNFKIQHLGYSWLTGRFNEFDGKFSWDDAKPEDAKIEVTINTDSVDSNHGKRDKHLKSDEFLHVSKFPTATFVSTKVEPLGDDQYNIHGDFTLHGVTKPIVIEAYKVGEGDSPWGDYRVGFSGTTSITMADYGITKNLGPASKDVELELHIEGIRQ